MRYKFVLACLTVSLACLFLAACNDDSGKPSASSKKEQAAATERWNSYVALSNESNAIMEIFSRYPDGLGMDPEPVVTGNGLERFVERVGSNSPFLNRINDDVTAKVIAQAENSAQTELDKAAKAFAESVKKSLTLQREAQQYYAAKSHVDDSMVKGKQMHPEIVAAWNELVSVYDAFSERMDEEDRLNAVREAARLREDGMKILPAALEFLIAAREGAAELERQQLTKETVHTMDTAAFKPYYDAMVKALADFQAVSNDEAQMEKEGIAKSHLGSFGGWSIDLKAAATTIMENATKGEPLSKGADKQGTPEFYMEKLNLVITGYNRLL